MYLGIKQVHAVPLNARKETGGYSEGIASFLQLPHISETIVKKIGRKVIMCCLLSLQLAACPTMCASVFFFFCLGGAQIHHHDCLGLESSILVCPTIILGYIPRKKIDVVILSPNFK